VGHVAWGERKSSYRVLVVKPKGKMTWKTGIDGMITCIFGKWNGGVAWAGVIWHRVGTGGGHL